LQPADRARHRPPPHRAEIPGIHGGVFQYARVLPWQGTGSAAGGAMDVPGAGFRDSSGIAAPRPYPRGGRGVGAPLSRAVRRRSGGAVVLSRPGESPAEPLLSGGFVSRTVSRYRTESFLIITGLVGSLTVPI